MSLGYGWRENGVKKEGISQRCHFMLLEMGLRPRRCSVRPCSQPPRFGGCPFWCKPQSCTERLAPRQSRCKLPSAQADFFHTAYSVSGQSCSIQLTWVVLLWKYIYTLTVIIWFQSLFWCFPHPYAHKEESSRLHPACCQLQGHLPPSVLLDFPCLPAPIQERTDSTKCKTDVMAMGIFEISVLKQNSVSMLKMACTYGVPKCCSSAAFAENVVWGGKAFLEKWTTG